MKITPAEDGQQEGKLEQILYPYGVGIDTHSRFIAVCVMLKEGDKVSRYEKEFPVGWTELCRARAWIEDKVKDQQFRYTIESTGCYHLPVIRAFKGKPSIVNPLLAGPTRRKTDVLDAKLLATHSITGLWKESFLVSDELQTMRIMWARRSEAKKSQRRILNRMNNTLLRYGHTFAAQSPLGSSHGQALLEALLLGRASASLGMCPEGLPDLVSTILRDMNEKQYEHGEKAKSAEKETMAFARLNEWPVHGKPRQGALIMEHLISVPGVGKTTAITWLCEIGDPGRFQNIKQVAAYCGCDPSVKVSAGKVTSYTKRKGNMKLHNALVYAAQGLLNRGTGPISNWGKSIAGRHKKGGFRKACGAVARRLAAALWHVHWRMVPFDISKYDLARVPRVPETDLKDIGLSAQTISKLKEKGVTTSQQLADQWGRGELASIKGFGDKAARTVRQWIQSITGPPQGKENKHDDTEER